MLSEYNKMKLKQSVDFFRQEAGSIDYLLQIGPKKLLDEARINVVEEVDPVAAANIRENQHEAEQYMAGLLGMM